MKLQVLYETHQSKCDILVTTWHCSILKVPCLLTVVALSVTQILMTLEMTLATFAPFLIDDPNEVIRLRKVFTVVLVSFRSAWRSAGAKRKFDT